MRIKLPAELFENPGKVCKERDTAGIADDLCKSKTANIDLHLPVASSLCGICIAQSKSDAVAMCVLEMLIEMRPNSISKGKLSREGIQALRFLFLEGFDETCTGKANGSSLQVTAENSQKLGQAQTDLAHADSPNEKIEVIFARNRHAPQIIADIGGERFDEAIGAVVRHEMQSLA